MENKNKNEAVEIIIDWASSGRNNSIYIFMYLCIYVCMYVCMYRIIVKEWTLHAQRMLKLPAYI